VNPEDIHKRPEWLKKYYWIACHHSEKPFDIQCWISFDCRSCQIYAEAAILRKEGQEFKMVSYDDDGANDNLEIGTQWRVCKLQIPMDNRKIST
jgi:hypothetical protein